MVVCLHPLFSFHSPPSVPRVVTDARDGWPESEMLQMSLGETARLANSMFLCHFFFLPVRSFFPPFLTLVDKRFISVRSLRSVPETNGLLAGDVPIIQGDGG